MNDKEKWTAAKLNEIRLAQAIDGVTSEEINAEFDVVRLGVLIEVKTLLEGQVDRVWMNKEALRRKRALARKLHCATMTVVFDERAGKEAIYYRRSTGGFRLGSLKRVANLSELNAVINALETETLRRRG